MPTTDGMTSRSVEQPGRCGPSVDRVNRLPERGDALYAESGVVFLVPITGFAEFAVGVGEPSQRVITGH